MGLAGSALADQEYCSPVNTGSNFQVGELKEGSPLLALSAAISAWVFADD
jgi:hypothetical protein